MNANSNKNQFKTALIGVEFEENLSLRYLAGSLISEGYAATKIFPYNSLFEMEGIVDSIIANDYDLVGISMAFQVRAIDDMAIVQLLRKRGFKKHITAGGQFATLHYDEIFSDCQGLDSIIRFEGESVIVSLADSLNNLTGLKDVPALVWRNAQNEIILNNALPIPRDINQLPFPLRKSERPEYLGFKSSHMVGSRGCHATCKYCCVSALVTERRKAAKDSDGMTAIAGTRRRTAKCIAIEIADLYFNFDIRIFEFQDDNWIHPKVSFAVQYFNDLKQELDNRGVGQIGLTLKTRADSVQPEIIQTLKEIGLIRVFVGIESGTQNLLTKLGRKSRDNVSLQALQTLRDFKIPAYFNALLFGPNIKFNEIEPELNFLALCGDFPFEIVEVVIYGKTGLYLSLKEENRLHGNYLDYEYNYLDEHTQKTHAIISKLETRHFGVYSPIKMAADLGFNMGILNVFYPGPRADQFAAEVAVLNQKINANQIQTIRKTANLVVEGLPVDTITELLIQETTSIDLQYYKEIIELQKEIENYVIERNKKHNTSAYYRAGAIVQSGLVASIFLMAMNGVYAQDENQVERELKKEVVELMYDFNAKDWREVEQKLMESKVPIKRYLEHATGQRDSINSVKGNYLDPVNETYKTLSTKFYAVNQKRLKEDYKRLKEILHSNNPKIKITSVLDIYLNQDGTVKDISVHSGKNKEDLTPELKKIILDLLKEKKFYAYEGRAYLSSPSNIRQNKRQSKRGLKKRMRMGPLD